MLETVLDCWRQSRDSQKELSGTAKEQQEVESDVPALTRRIRLMEEEDKKSAETLCGTVTKLAMTSKAADNVMETIKVVKNTSIWLNNEVTIEELDKNFRSTTKMAADIEQKADQISNKYLTLGTQTGTGRAFQ